MSSASLPDDLAGWFETVGRRCEWGCKDYENLHLHCRKCGTACAKSLQCMTRHFEEHHTVNKTSVHVKFTKVTPQRSERVQSPCRAEGEPHYHLNWPFLETTQLYYVDFETDTVYGDGNFTPCVDDKPSVKALASQYVCLDSFLQDLPSDAVPFIMELQEKFCQVPPYLPPEGDTDSKAYVHISNFLLFILVASRWSAKCALFQNELLEALCHMSFPSVKCWRRNENCCLRVFRKGEGVRAVAETPRRHALTTRDVQTTFTYHVDGKLDTSSACMKIKSDQKPQQQTNASDNSHKGLDYFVAKEAGTSSKSSSAVNITLDQGVNRMSLEVHPVDPKDVPLDVHQQVPQILALKSVFAGDGSPPQQLPLITPCPQLSADETQRYPQTESNYNSTLMPPPLQPPPLPPPPPPPHPPSFHQPPPPPPALQLPPLQPSQYLPPHLPLTFVPETNFHVGVSQQGIMRNQVYNPLYGPSNFHNLQQMHSSSLHNLHQMSNVHIARNQLNNFPPYGAFAAPDMQMPLHQQGIQAQHLLDRNRRRNMSTNYTVRPPGHAGVAVPPVPVPSTSKVRDVSAKESSNGKSKKKRKAEQAMEDSPGMSGKVQQSPANKILSKEGYILEKQQAAYKNFWDKIAVMAPLVSSDKPLSPNRSTSIRKTTAENDVEKTLELIEESGINTPQSDQENAGAKVNPAEEKQSTTDNARGDISSKHDTSVEKMTGESSKITDLVPSGKDPSIADKHKQTGGNDPTEETRSSDKEVGSNSVKVITGVSDFKMRSETAVKCNDEEQDEAVLTEVKAAKSAHNETLISVDSGVTTGSGSEIQSQTSALDVHAHQSVSTEDALTADDKHPETQEAHSSDNTLDATSKNEIVERKTNDSSVTERLKDNCIALEEKSTSSLTDFDNTETGMDTNSQNRDDTEETKEKKEILKYEDGLCARNATEKMVASAEKALSMSAETESIDDSHTPNNTNDSPRNTENQREGGKSGAFVNEDNVDANHGKRELKLDDCSASVCDDRTMAHISKGADDDADPQVRRDSKVDNNFHLEAKCDGSSNVESQPSTSDHDSEHGIIAKTVNADTFKKPGSVEPTIIHGDMTIDKTDETKVKELILNGKCCWPSCSQCFMIFDTEKYANLHAVLHSLASQDGFHNKLRCINCAQNGHFWYLMIKHLSHHHGCRLVNSKHCCFLCGLDFSSRASLEHHQGFHFNSKLYRCIYCCQVTGNWALMKEHLEDCQGDKTSGKGQYFSCPYCNQNMYTMEERLLHVHSHTELGFLCVMCKSNNSYSWTTMKRHYLSNHFYKTDGSVKVLLPTDLQYSCHRVEIFNLANSAFFPVPLKEALCPVSTHTSTYKCIYNCDTFLETAKYAKLHNALHVLADTDAALSAFNPRDPYKCSHCNFGTHHWYLILNHMKHAHNDVHVDSETACYLCGLDFASPSELDNHQETHANGRLKCTLCSKVFNTWHNIKDHMPQCESIGGVPNYPCAFCYIVFRKKEECQLHMDSHGDTAFRCTQCDDFDADQASWATLKKHYMNEHNLSVYCKKRLHKCPDCDKVYKNQKGLKQHRFSVHEGGVRKCPHCEKKFKSTDALRVHVDSKHGYKINMRCEICGFEAETVELLQAHQQADHKKHKCERCNMTFTSEDDLEKHVAETHPREPNSVQCIVCKIWLPNAKLLKRHKLYQHNPHRIPMRCTMCGYRTFKKLELKNHMIKKHDLGAPDPDQEKADPKRKNTANITGSASSHTARRKRRRSEELPEGTAADAPHGSLQKRSRTSSRNEALVLDDMADEYTLTPHMSIYTTPRARASALAKMERLQKANEKKEDLRLQLEQERERKRVLKQKAKARKERMQKRKQKNKLLKSARKQPNKDAKSGTAKKKKERKRRSTNEDAKKENHPEEKKSKKAPRKDKDEKKSSPKEGSPKSDRKKKEKPGLTHRYRPLSEPHCDHSYCRRPAQESTSFEIHTLSKEDVAKGDWVISAEDEVYGIEIETSPQKNFGSDCFDDPYGDLVLGVPKIPGSEDVIGSPPENIETLSVGTLTSSVSVDKSVSFSIVNSRLHSSLQLSASQMEQIPCSPPAQLLQTESTSPDESNHDNSTDETILRASPAGVQPPDCLATDHPSESKESSSSVVQFEDDVEVPDNRVSSNVTADKVHCDEDRTATCEHSYASRVLPVKHQPTSDTVEEVVNVTQDMICEAEPQIFDHGEADNGIHGNETDVIDPDMLPNMDILDALLQQSVQDNEDLLSLYEKD